MGSFRSLEVSSNWWQKNQWQNCSVFIFFGFPQNPIETTRWRPQSLYFDSQGIKYHKLHRAHFRVMQHGILWSWFTAGTYIIIIWNLGKKGALRTAIDLQEEELTFLQEREAVNEKQWKKEPICMPRQKAQLMPIFQKFPQIMWLLETDGQ
jgi:hypothetical protein